MNSFIKKIIAIKIEAKNKRVNLKIIELTCFFLTRFYVIILSNCNLLTSGSFTKLKHARKIPNYLVYEDITELVLPTNISPDLLY